MSYVGNTATTQAFTPAVDFFSGNGSTVAFTLSRPVASVAQVQAVISNVPQNPGDAYTVSGNTITFTSAPPSGTNNIYVYYTSPITQVIAPGQGTVLPTSLSTGGPYWDTSGNVGVNTSSPAYKLDVQNAGGLSIRANNTSSTSPAQFRSTNTLTTVNFGVDGTGGYVETQGAYPTLFYTGGSERMRLDASGNLGIGTTSPAKKLDVSTGDIRLSSGYTVQWGGTANYIYGDSTSNFFVVATNGAERARIDSSGNLLVGGTTALGKVTVYQDLGGVGDAISIRDTGSSYGSGAVYIKFQNNAGSQAGAIQHTASTTVNYATSSDARLKTDIGVATDTSVIDSIVIHDFEWKEDGRVDRGVFAQEAYEVKPSAVSVGNDETNEDGILINPWGVDYSKFVPDLIVHAKQLKAIVQEQQAIINQLTARIEVLEAK